MKKSINLIVVFGTIWISQSCISNSSMQTARTVGKGSIGGGVGFGFAKYNDNIINYSSPMIDGIVKYGVSDKVDIGAKISLTGTLGADVKYQFFGDSESKFAGSVGGGAAFVNITSGEAKTSIFDLSLPTYFSYHPQEKIGIYLNPQLINRSYSYSGSVSNKSSVSSLFYGGALGMRYGTKNALIVEFSYLTGSLNYPQAQFTLGYSIGLK